MLLEGWTLAQSASLSRAMTPCVLVIRNYVLVINAQKNMMMMVMMFDIQAYVYIYIYISQNILLLLLLMLILLNIYKNHVLHFFCITCISLTELWKSHLIGRLEEPQHHLVASQEQRPPVCKLMNNVLDVNAQKYNMMLMVFHIFFLQKY